MSDPKALRTEIEKRFGTPYRLWKRSGICKSKFYQTLAGSYPGDQDKALAQIRAAMEGRTPEQDVFEAVKQVACAKCHVKGRCERCDALFKAQARAALDVLG